MLGLGPVSMVGLREWLTRWGPANVTVPTLENLMDSRSLFLTANANTPYTWMWLDLSDGPLVAEIPPNGSAKHQLVCASPIKWNIAIATDGRTTAIAPLRFCVAACASVRFPPIVTTWAVRRTRPFSGVRFDSA